MDLTNRTTYATVASAVQASLAKGLGIGINEVAVSEMALNSARRKLWRFLLPTSRTPILTVCSLATLRVSHG